MHPSLIFLGGLGLDFEEDDRLIDLARSAASDY
jgi:hypothetical protein